MTMQVSMHDSELLAEALATLDMVTSESPLGTVIIIACKKEDGTFLRGILNHNQKDRLIVRARFHKRQNIPIWHPDSEKQEWIEIIEKSELRYLDHTARSPKISLARAQSFLHPVEEPALVFLAA